jgi:hypothetical protein
MTVVAQITTEDERADLSQALTGFNEDSLTVERETDSPSTETRTLEVRTSEGEVLTQFHEACVEHDIMLDIRRIYQEPVSTTELAAGESEDQRAN